MHAFTAIPIGRLREDIGTYCNLLTIHLHVNSFIKLRGFVRYLIMVELQLSDKYK